MAKNQQPALPLPTPKYEAADQLRREEAQSHKLDEGAPSLKKVVPPTTRTAAPEMKEAPLVPAAPPPASDAFQSEQKDQGLISTERRVAPKAAARGASEAGRSRDMELIAPAAPVSSGVAGGVAANVPAESAESAPMAKTSESVTVEGQAQALSTTSAEVQLQAGGAANLLRVAAADRRYIVAPGEKYAWRVGEEGKIERSTDQGKSWKAQNSGVSADLTAGSATSEKVCWVVGKAGTILLTTDGGKHWEQITSPISGDLGGIHASDAMHASIWDVPNRNSFETSDGGATWKRIANE
jgi:hypothetical protein